MLELCCPKENITMFVHYDLLIEYYDSIILKFTTPMEVKEYRDKQVKEYKYDSHSIYITNCPKALNYLCRKKSNPNLIIFDGKDSPDLLKLRTLARKHRGHVVKLHAQPGNKMRWSAYLLAIHRNLSSRHKLNKSITS